MKNISILQFIMFKHIIEKQAVPPLQSDSDAHAVTANHQSDGGQVDRVILDDAATGPLTQDDEVSRVSLAAQYIATIRTFEQALRFAGWTRTQSKIDARMRGQL